MQKKRMIMKKEEGIDGILVTVGLCIIALVLCALLKNQLTTFITTTVEGMTNKAASILDEVNTVPNTVPNTAPEDTSGDTE